jgi:hypothetical protein
MPCVHPNINFWQNKIAADQLYQHLLLTAEKKFWRCVESGEPHRLFGAEAPRARIEAIHSASRNAFRHGLAAITRCNPALFPEIERMAEALCGDDKNPFLFEQALTIAENQLVLRCVRARTRRHDRTSARQNGNPAATRQEFGASEHEVSPSQAYLRAARSSQGREFGWEFDLK